MRNLSQLRLSLDETGEQMKSSRAVHARQVAVLDQERIENDARGLYDVLAPISGTVSLQGIKPGQSVQAGQHLISLIAINDTLEAELDVPSRAVGFVSEGNPVRLRYHAFPYQKFGHHLGIVTGVSKSTAIIIAKPPDELAATNSDTRYRVVVRPESQTVTAYGKQEPLRAGMLIEADLIGERRTIGEWLFEPLYSVKGALTSS